MGSIIYLGLMAGPICPVKALLVYLSLLGSAPGPLFLSQDGSSLSRSSLVAEVRAALESRGLDVRGFNGHSICIGAATAAAACGMEDSLIQALGRWGSSAFYIPTSRDKLISVSAALLSHPWQEL